MGSRNADECVGGGFTQTITEVPQAHSRIDEDNNRAGLEEGKREDVEFQARRHHQHRAHTAADADLFEPASDDVGLGIQLPKGEMAIAHPAGAIAAMRLDQGQRLRQSVGH